ncbi:phage tail protein [Sphingopyxis sp.]|uniref:phage tail protein n=1 Tax=Sphingopyxis sp. TaxID=1908224 RepID=UPI002585187E|nr:phage tail protein [Sphingopyxis sp.]
MATLVLTVVGGIVGGPVGAAIGAAVGQQVDAAIFKPKGREGPRLADLKVQASTYGQQIPKLFGTMRVAGSVIWATDLIERRTKSGGGKGRPSVTEYSYAVSLAVALSSRPIRAVRRIWADGNLLRGVSGSFRERCVFRSHDGGEDQAVDPLIAAALGPASASAFRGLAYVVFEELELAAFGNRIPSLTFEVEADAGTVDAGSVANALLGDPARAAGLWPFGGYAASGDRARDALTPLFDVDAVRLRSAPADWRLLPAEAEQPFLAPDAYSESRRDWSASDIVEHRRMPLGALPASIRLRHYEPERDYQLGQQMAVVAGGGAREDRMDLPAVLAAGSARALAQRLAASATDGRETIVWEADLAALALPVGGLIMLPDGGVWRIASRSVKAASVRIELRRYRPPSVTELVADPGAPVVAPDWPDSEGVVRLFDLPSMGAAATAPRVLVAAAGGNDGWRGADLWFRGGADMEPVAIGTARPALALGALTAPLEPGPTGLFDRANSLVVALSNVAMTLESIGDAALLAGGNRAMVGGELLQFGAAESLGGGLWRLTVLLRGLAGTDDAMAHGAGEPFVLLDDAALWLLPDDMARQAESGESSVEWARRGGIELVDVPVPSAARALRPLSPVHGYMRAAADGAIEARWVRRSRADLGWRDQVDLPIGEGRELWQVMLVPAVPGHGPWDCTGSRLVLDAVLLAAIPAGSALSVRQVGDFGLSPPLLLPLA